MWATKTSDAEVAHLAETIPAANRHRAEVERERAGVAGGSGW